MEVTNPGDVKAGSRQHAAISSMRQPGDHNRRRQAPACAAHVNYDILALAGMHRLIPVSARVDQIIPHHPIAKAAEPTDRRSTPLTSGPEVVLRNSTGFVSAIGPEEP
jgi:hypothetical protein